MPRKKTPEKLQESIPSPEGVIEVLGARTHNLKKIDVSIPRNQLVVMTGLSGSGKSSLAFDTIFAEGQRRYMESFSAYARQFIGNLERPDVDQIYGLSPVISIEQKTVSRNPRSTVGTITEVYDFLRLLYARASEAFSWQTGKKMVRLNEDQIIQRVAESFMGEKIAILAPVVKGRKGHYREVFEQIRKNGYSRVRVDGQITDVIAKMQVDRFKIHDIEIVIDRLEPSAKQLQRLRESVKTALKAGKGIIQILQEETNETRFFSKFLMDPESGLSYDEPQPNTFSFNSPYGACPHCNGLGYVSEIEVANIIPDPKLSIMKGGLAPLGEYRENWTFTQIRELAKRVKFGLGDPLEKLNAEAMKALLYGYDDPLKIDYTFSSGYAQTWSVQWEGLIPLITRHYLEKSSDGIAQWAEEFMTLRNCPECDGNRLKKEALCFKIDDASIADLSKMDLINLAAWMKDLPRRMNEKQRQIGSEVIKEINTRLEFLLGVGLGYLSLNSPAKTLSGGEAQRIRLATQIGSQLTGVLYILDEPSIGLHQRDNGRLIQSLKDLRDIGNSVLVVEHDKDMIMEADHVIDVGPGAGVHGGHIVAQGNVEEFMKQGSLTADYLSGRKRIPVPEKRRKGNGKWLKLSGATGHNLKGVDVTFPLGTFIAVTGVSGSGKSSLISETLYPILRQKFHGSHRKPLPYKKVTGLDQLDKVIEIDQSPIGRTPRSNPATYVEVFGDIRNLFSALPEAKIRGYKPGRFSFNVKGGRCETCQGGGMRLIEMNFLPDVYVPCETCQGKRYNRETLEVRYKGKSISDVLDMSIEQAVEFFEAVPSVVRKIQTLQDVGLGYLTLGQNSTTLSGGEAQRVKLASELSRRDTGNTFYILDEPTTGLHFEDVKALIHVLNELVEKGNTVLVIEHHMDVIKVADYVVDMGPEGGRDGGQVVFQGTPEDLTGVKESHTGIYLKSELLLAQALSSAYRLYLL